MDEQSRRVATQADRDIGHPGGAAVRRAKGLMFVMRFDDALRLVTEEARHTRRVGDERAWRRLTNQRGLALMALGRFADAVATCDKVIASVPEHEDRGAVAQAWNVSAIAACRAPRDDTVRRVDAALALGEWFLREESRADSLARAAWTAGTVGFVELGDRILTRIVEDVDAGVIATLSPASLLWLRAQQISERLWSAVALEHHGDPRSMWAVEEALELLHRVLPGTAVLPAKGAAIFQAMQGYALVVLGRAEQARAPIAAAAASLPGEPPDLFTTAVQLILGCCVLRSESGSATPERVAGLVRQAQWCGDVRTEAEVWRLAASAVDDPARAAVARERFEALADVLDWRRRLQEVDTLHLRSQWLRQATDAGEWRSRPYPQP